MVGIPADVLCGLTWAKTIYKTSLFLACVWGMNYLTTSGNSSFRIQGHGKNKTLNGDVSDMMPVNCLRHRLQNEEETTTNTSDNN